MNARLAELYDFEGNLLQRVADPDYDSPKIIMRNSQLVFSEDAGTLYLDAISDENYIYALYSNHSYYSDEGSYGREIHIYDWDLNFQKKVLLDHYSLSIEAAGRGGLYSIEHHPQVSIRYIKDIIDA